MSPDWSPNRGQVVDERYELRDVIGSGGMGVVHAGFDLRLQRPVAVKLLNPTAAADAAALQRFQREALAAGRIGHENICDVRDMGTTEQGTPYIVMELLDGAPLSDRLLAAGRLAPEEAVPIALQVLSALDAAHAAGIVHRDLKPENVFLTESTTGEQRAKIVDFGISKALADVTDLRLTETGVVVGSPYYMSPEQARGRRDVDGRSDLWSLGVILYELLTGRLPFEGDNYNEVMINIVTKEPAPPSAIRPELSASLERAVMRALTKDRNERFANAREMAAALGSGSVRAVPTPAAALSPPQAPEQSPELGPQHAPPEPRRTRSRGGVVAAAIVGGVVALGLVAGLLFVGTGGDEALLDAATPRPPEAVAALSTAPPAAEAQALAAVVVDGAPAARTVTVAVTGVPDGAVLDFDGVRLTEPRLVGEAGHRGELVVTFGSAEPLRLIVTLEADLAIDLAERIAAARRASAAESPDAAPAAPVDAGAAQRRRAGEPPGDEPPRANRPARGERYIRGRANSRITLEYE
jgi:serine/threonine-protein kinase